MKILTAKFVLPVSQPLIGNGAVAIEETKIAEVGPLAAIQSRYPNAEIEDFGNAVLMPGLVNAHTHIDLLHYQGTGSAPQFFEWLIGSWEHQKKLSPTDRRQCFTEAVRQLLGSGTTTVGDTGFFSGTIPQLVNQPLRMVLFPEMVSGGEKNVSEAYEGLFNQVDEILDSNASHLSAGLAPYAAYTLSKNLLKIISQQAKTLQVPLKLHAAETFSEMQFFFESSGEIADKLFPLMGWKEQLPTEHRLTPVQYLNAIGFLDVAPTLVGCNQVSDADVEFLSKRGVKVIHTPRLNHHLKLGQPPFQKLRKAKIPIGLGSDSIGSLYSLSLWEEMRFLKDHDEGEQKLTSSEILSMATLEGAQALGLSRMVGSLEPQKLADLIAVKISPDTAPQAAESQVADALVAQTSDREIAAVWIQGQRIKV